LERKKSFDILEERRELVRGLVYKPIIETKLRVDKKEERRMLGNMSMRGSVALSSPLSNFVSKAVQNNKAEMVVAKLDQVINWARKGSIWYSNRSSFHFRIPKSSLHYLQSVNPSRFCSKNLAFIILILFGLIKCRILVALNCILLFHLHPFLRNPDSNERVFFLFLSELRRTTGQ